jgi:hypothetical protein
MTSDREHSLDARVRAALRAFRNPVQFAACRHTSDDHWCIECSRDTWAQTAFDLRVKLQNAEAK